MSGDVRVTVEVGGHKSTFMMPPVDPLASDATNMDLLAYTHEWVLRCFGEAHRAYGRAVSGQP